MVTQYEVVGSEKTMILLKVPLNQAVVGLMLYTYLALYPYLATLETLQKKVAISPKYDFMRHNR